MEEKNTDNKIMDLSDPSVEFEDMESYTGGASSIKQIVMSQYSKCCTESSKEMVSGGIKKIVIDGRLIEVPVPNQVEIFINSVQTLKFLLEPYMYPDDKGKREKMKGFRKKIDSFYNGMEEINNEKKQKMDELNKKAYLDNPAWREIYLKQYNDAMFNINKIYQNKMVVIYKNLFVTLGFLLHSENYFDEGRGGS